MNELIELGYCARDIFRLAFSVIPQGWFLLVLPAAAFVAFVKFVRSM